MTINNEKVWKVKNHNDVYTDEEVINFIKEGKLKADDYLMSKDMKDWIKLEDSIYQFYLKEKEDETI